MIDNQMKAFQACIQSVMETTNKLFDAFLLDTTRDLTDLKTSLQFSQIKLQELKQRYIHDFEQHKNTYKDVEHINTELKKLENTADYLENQSRRNNLRFDGIKERTGESWAEDALRRVLQQQLKLLVEQAMAMPIERANRTIVVKFRSFKDRDAVLQAARVNKPQGMFVNEDFSQRVVSRRK